MWMNTESQLSTDLRCYGLKRCNDCSRVKPLAEFTSYKQNGYRRYRACCKKCASLRTMTWHKARQQETPR